MNGSFGDMEMLQMLSSSLRTYVLNLPGQWAGLVIGCAMMERKRKLMPLIIYLAIKTLFFILLDDGMNFYFAEEPWVQYPMTIGTFWGAVLTCLMFNWTFKGGFIKVVTGMNVAEILTTLFLLPSVIIVNALEGREVLTDMTGTFQVLDLLSGVLMFAFLVAVYPFTAQFLKKYREYDFKHKKLMWILLGGYFIITQSIPFFGLRDDRMLVLTMYLLHMFSAVVIIAGVYLVYKSSQRRIQRENEFLSVQINLMENHYRAIQQQIHRMESGRKVLEQQVKELVGHQRMFSYIKDLQAEYEQIQAGMYCNDWMVDAVLYCQIETARRQGIEVDCSLQGYSRGMISEEDVMKLLLELLDFGIRKNQQLELSSQKQMCLRMTTVKNMLVTDFIATGNKKTKFKGNAVKNCVEKYSGTWSAQWRENVWHVVALLQIQMD